MTVIHDLSEIKLQKILVTTETGEKLGVVAKDRLEAISKAKKHFMVPASHDKRFAWKTEVVG